MTIRVRPSSARRSLEQVQDLGLDRDVEGRHRLIAHEQVAVRRTGPARYRSAAAGRPRTRAGSGPRSAALRPTRSSRLATRARAPWPSRSRRSPTVPPMISPTVIRGSSDVKGSWKTIPMRRRMRAKRGPPEVRDVRPVEQHAPASGSSSRTMQRASVDLPQPDSPTIPMAAPASTENDTPSTARTTCGRRPSRPRRTGKCRTSWSTASNGERAVVHQAFVRPRNPLLDSAGEHIGLGMARRHVEMARELVGRLVGLRRERARPWCTSRGRPHTAVRRRSPRVRDRGAAGYPGWAAADQPIASDGSEPISPQLYGWAGRPKSWTVGPSSTIHPAYMTATSSQLRRPRRDRG